MPESAFPFRNDLLFGTDHKDKNRFKRNDESIAFVCKHLRLHGFGFVLDEEGLDVYQLEILMVTSWSILQVMGGKKEYPSDTTFKELSLCEEIKAIVQRIADQRQSNDVDASSVEQSCISLLP